MPRGTGNDEDGAYLRRIDIDLEEHNVGILLRKLLQLGGNHSARTTPFREKVHQNLQATPQ